MDIEDLLRTTRSGRRSLDRAEAATMTDEAELMAKLRELAGRPGFVR